MVVPVLMTDTLATRLGATATILVGALLVLLLVLGSVTPAGGVIVAVLTKLLPTAPVAVPVTLNVSDAFGGMVGITKPVPCKPAIVGAAGQAAPAVVEPQLTAVNAKPATAGSRTNAPSAAPGPALVTVKT